MSVAQSRPQVTVGTTQREITAYGGAELLRETMRAVGLGEAVEERLHLKQRARGLSEAEFVCGMAEAVACGAACLDDLAVHRADEAQTALRGFALPAPQTAGSWLRRFYLPHVGQLDRALEEVVHDALVLSGVGEVTLDFDSTHIRSRSSRRQGADPTYKKMYALHPLLCFEAGTGAAVHARLRRGRAGPSTGMKGFLGETLRRVPEDVAVRARLDSGFYGGELLGHLEGAEVTYLCGVPMTPPIAAACRNIPDQLWEPCLDKDDGEVAEFGYRMHNGRTFRRYVCKRIPVEVGEQPTLEGAGYHHWVFVTNDHHRPAADLEREHRHKAQVEGGVRELKENFGLHALRKHGFMANWVWLLLLCLGHNLCCWTQRFGRIEGSRHGVALRAKRFRHRFLVVPGMLVRSARKLVLKLRFDYPYLDRFRAALQRLRHLAAPAG